eukprot:GHVT01029971.1.p2 GENE.GHVT01029971.1~~GHVT01029971.1.p2  ORF type:complete len:277 (+),score=74.26 GHVT01029971.1:526-1356(+)
MQKDKRRANEEREEEHEKGKNNINPRGTSSRREGQIKDERRDLHSGAVAVKKEQLEELSGRTKDQAALPPTAPGREKKEPGKGAESGQQKNHKENQEQQKDKNKHMLDFYSDRWLFHGSPLANVVGILSRGLRVAPANAPLSGLMFGRGIYLTDVASKAAQYCNSTAQHPIGCLMVCQTSLGRLLCLRRASPCTARQRLGYDAVHGLGGFHPDPSQQKVFSLDGTPIVVPSGEIVPSGIADTSLLYNEFVVYDPSRVRVRFLLEIEFDFSAGCLFN